MLRLTVWLGGCALGALVLGGCNSSSSTDGTGGTGGTGGAAPAGLIAYAKAPNDLDPPQVFTIAPDGTGERQLTQPAGSDWPTDANEQPVFSPDGQHIVFASGRGFSGGGGGGVPNPTLRTLYVMAPDGTGPVKLTGNDPMHCSEHSPRYSHDGQWIVFSLNCDDDAVTPFVDKIYRIHADGTGQQRLASADPISTADNNVVDPAWSFDDQTVYCSVLPGGTSSDLYAIDIAAGTSTKLTDQAASSRYIEGAPMALSGGDIVYATIADMMQPVAAPQMDRMHADGSGHSVLFAIDVLAPPSTLAGLAHDYDFALTPDEQSFVFASYADANASTPTSILATEALDGTSGRTIGPPGLGLATPSWH